MESDIGGEEFAFAGTGTFTADNQRGTMEGQMTAGGEEIDFEAITDGEFMFLKGDGFGAPAGKWIKTPDPPTSTLSPTEFVGFLKDSDGVEEVGTETIRGEETTHYRGPLNLEELASESGSDVIERLRSTPNADKLEMVVDVWVTSDGLPARLALDVTAPGEAEGSLKMTSDITEYDVPVDAEPPPASDVIEAGG